LIYLFPELRELHTLYEKRTLYLIRKMREFL
jgi:hypothetical protein